MKTYKCASCGKVEDQQRVRMPEKDYYGMPKGWSALSLYIPAEAMHQMSFCVECTVNVKRLLSELAPR